MALLLPCPNPSCHSSDPQRCSANPLLSAADRSPLFVGRLHVRKERIDDMFFKGMGVRISSSKGKRMLVVQSVASDRDTQSDMLLIKEYIPHPKTCGVLQSLFVANASMLIFPFRALAETCEGANSIFNMPLLFAIAFIGATVGGLLARQRKAELARLNDQLRQINAALRRQAKIESYAPQLSYAPVGRVAEADVIVDPRKEQLIGKLREGKQYLRIQDPERAFQEFKAAFDLAASIGDHVEEKKAARGLGASLQRQGKYKDAIRYHSKVLEIAKRSGEESGSTEAYGAIADCYTELGDLEKAGKFYDKYIARLETD